MGTDKLCLIRTHTEPDPREGKECSLPACRLFIPICKKENIILTSLLTVDMVHINVNMIACLFDIQIKKAVHKPVAIFLSAKDVKCDFRLKGSKPDCLFVFFLSSHLFRNKYYVNSTMTSFLLYYFKIY